MTILWPRESVARPSPDIKGATCQLVEKIPEDFPPLDSLVQSIIVHECSTEELLERAAGLCDDLAVHEVPDREELLVAWGCAKALAESPNLHTWQSVRELTSHSHVLEHGLSDVLAVYVDQNAEAKPLYIDIAKEAMRSLDCFQLESQFDRQNEERTVHKHAWDNSHDKLSELWRGLWWGDSSIYMEEFPLFQIIEMLDQAEFFNALSVLNNPHLVESVFWATQVGERYELWSRLIEDAPRAFNDDNGSWNGTLVVPFLLATANRRIMDASSSLTFNSTGEDEKRVRDEINQLADAVAGSIAVREDAVPLYVRWATWLMQQILMSGFGEVEKIRSSAVVEMALLEAIGQKIQQMGVLIPENPPEGASDMEAWCRTITLCFWAYNGFIPAPNFTTLGSEWVMEADDWAGDKGKMLRAHFSSELFLGRSIPGDAAGYLAYAILGTGAPVDDWINWWNELQYLREIVEFGDADAHKSQKYEAQSDAAKLLLFACCIGLSLMDQCALNTDKQDPVASGGIVRLHAVLESAVREMLAFDTFLTGEKWRVVFQHLAIRRLLWEQSACAAGGIEVFAPSDQPTFSDYLRALKNDAPKLVELLQSVLLNKLQPQKLKEKLSEAEVDLPRILEIVKQLSSISPKKYPVNDEQLRVIETLF